MECCKRRAKSRLGYGEDNAHDGSRVVDVWAISSFMVQSHVPDISKSRYLEHSEESVLRTTGVRPMLQHHFLLC